MMIDFKEEYEEAAAERKRPKLYFSWSWKVDFFKLFKKLIFWRK